MQSNNWYQRPWPLAFLISAPVAPRVHKLAVYLDLCLIFLLLRFSLKSRHGNTSPAHTPKFSLFPPILKMCICYLGWQNEQALRSYYLVFSPWPVKPILRTVFHLKFFRFLNQMFLPRFVQGTLHFPLPVLAGQVSTYLRIRFFLHCKRS